MSGYVRISRKPFLIDLIHSLWGPCQPPVSPFDIMQLVYIAGYCPNFSFKDRSKEEEPCILGNEVRAAIAACYTGKTSGEDNIPANLLKVG